MERKNIPEMDEVISGGFTQRTSPGSRNYVRVVSWNIERGQQFSGIVDFLQSADADLILLQEVDLNVRRTQYRDVAYELALSLRMNYVFGKEFEELGAGSDSTPAHHGLATLSPWPLSKGRLLRFERQSNFWKPRWYVPQAEVFQRRLGGRIALIAEALIDNQRFVTYNLHLESKGNEDLRVQQLRQTLEDARTHSESSMVIVAGDFNLHAGSREPAETLGRLGFHHTVGQAHLKTTARHAPWQRARSIDWICVAGEIAAEGRVHRDIRTSDHYPISATLAIPQPRTKEDPQA
jgi:endonuclease/exonuclease/phosphatase family metal-dependent hydrolase